MILQKYVPAVNSLAIVILSALVAIPSGMLDFTTGAQLVSVTLAGVALYIFPLLNIKWQAAGKVILAMLGAAVSTAFPIFQTVVNGEPFRPMYIALIVLAVAQVLGTQVGVDIRVDAGNALVRAATQAVPVVTQKAEVTAQAVSAVPTPLINTYPYSTADSGYEGYSEYEEPATPTTAEIAAVNPANQEDDSDSQ